TPGVERPPPLLGGRRRPRPRGGARSRARTVAPGRDRARSRRRRRAGALGVRIAARAVPRAQAAAVVQASDGVDVARDRGRMPGTGRAATPVRLLPARAFLPELRASV